MPDFQFLRLQPPDVMRYLPKFLAEDEHFRKVQAGLNVEHEQRRQAIIDLAQQFFIDTATWGLSAWERIYQTNPPSGASIDLRRSLLRAKKLGTRTMTKENLELLINQFVTGQDAYIVEIPTPGCLQVNVPSAVKYWDSLEDMLSKMVPAHLTYFFHYIAEFSDIVGGDEFGNGDEQLFVRASYKIEDEYPWPGKRLDGSLVLGGRRFLDGTWSLDGSINLEASVGGFTLDGDHESLILSTVRMAGFQEDFGQTAMVLNGLQRLDGGITFGADDLPFDDSGEIEIRRNVRYLDGKWMLSSGDVPVLDGTLLLDGSRRLSEGGIYLETYRERTTL